VDRQFNRGEFFEQHETLELLWRASVATIRCIYQGILQQSASRVIIIHLHRLNHHGMVYMLTDAGSNYLRPVAPLFHQ